MKFAYADPPYFGCSRRYYGDHPLSAVFDTVGGHLELVANMRLEYEHWALSCRESDLAWLLPACGSRAHVAVWVKGGAQPGAMHVIRSFEPVIYVPLLRPREKGLMVRDSLVLGYGNQYKARLFVGAKPAGFTRWLVELLGMGLEDELVDLFPGSGAVAAVAAQGRLVGVGADADAERPRDATPLLDIGT